MATNNSWNNQVTAAYNQIILNSGSNGVAIGTDNAAGAITIGTGTVARNINIGLSAAAHVITIGTNNGVSSLGLNAGTGDMTLISGDAITLDAAGVLELNSTGGIISIGNDANNFGVNVGTAGTRTVTVGSVTSTSATTLQSGSGALAVTATGGTLTINSGIGALAISNDASATTISIGTGGAVKTVTLGSTNTTSTTVIKSGSGNVTINSGLTIDSTGRNKNAVQPAFFAYLSAPVTNVTGNSVNYIVLFDTEVFDQASNYDPSTGIFTAPIAGRYYFSTALLLQDLGVAHTTADIGLFTTGQQIHGSYINSGVVQTGGLLSVSVNALVNMAASDTAKININVASSTQTVDVNGQAAAYTYFCGNLVC